jgi:uncharacterized membrane protein
VYEASVAVHVAAAVVGFGATFSYPVIQVLAERRHRRALPFAHAAILAISRWLAVPATVVVGATGLYQVAAGPYGLRELWVALGLTLYLGVMAVATAYLAPAYGRARTAAQEMLAAALPGEPLPLSPAYRAATRGVNVVGPLVALAVLAIVALMVVKPG